MSKLWVFLRNHLLFTVSLLLIISILSLTLFGIYLPIVDGELTEENHRTENGVLYTPPFEPSEENLLGSDHQGRDLLSLIIIGAKETLLIVLLITVLRYLIAIPLSFLAHKNILGANFVVKSLNTFFSYVPTVIIVIKIGRASCRERVYFCVAC